jgi:YHS domain-containing protein
MREDLTTKIQAAFEAADKKLRDLRAEKVAEFETLQRRHAVAEKVRDRVVQEIMRPCLEELLSHFDNAELQADDTPLSCSCAVRFKHTPRFPAGVTLQLVAAFDAGFEHLLVIYDLEILPIFLEYQKTAQISLPLDAVDDEALRNWIEDRLVEFVETYLKLEFVDQYQRDNMVTDPVANLRISRLIAQGQADHAGHTYYFLTKENEQAFRADPTQYVCPTCPH